MKNAKPSINPADEDSLVGAFRNIFGKLLQNVDTMLPAKVVAFNGDRNKPRVTVHPQIAVLTTNHERVSRAQIASLPVVQFGGGGHLISCNIKPGDFGWIVASDRDISLFLQNYKETQPNTVRKHNFADAIFIPDILTGYNIAAEDNQNFVIQNVDGTVRIAFWPDYIKITAPHVGINADPVPGAAVQIDDTTKAFIPPRMTTAQRNAIPSPIEGMTIYNTTVHGLQTYTNTGWP